MSTFSLELEDSDLELKGLLKRKRNEYGKKVRKEYGAKRLQVSLKELRDWTIGEQKHSNTISGVQIDNLLVFIPTNGINMQHKYMKKTSKPKSIQETLLPLEQTKSPTTTSYVRDFLAKHLVSLESVEDLTTPEGLYFLTSLGFSRTKDPDIFYSKTSKVYFLTTPEKLSRQYLGFSPIWGMSINGRFLTAKTSDALHGFGHGWQGYHNKKAVKMGLIRRLTPTECERLQGFPDGWTEGVSDTQRYKCLGNAVTVNVIGAITKKIIEES